MSSLRMGTQHENKNKNEVNCMASEIYHGTQSASVPKRRTQGSAWKGK